MRLSSKTRIGVQALTDLAFHCGGRHAQAKEIAERQQIPVRTLEEVLQDLRKAGFIEAQRGPRGGYALRLHPHQITISQIVRALDGPVEAPLAPRRRGVANRAAVSNVPELVWEDLAARIAAVLGDTTLHDFITRAERTAVQSDPVDSAETMYFI